MPIRLIDENATTPVDIEGTIFHVKHLPWSGRQKFAKEMQGLVVEEGLPCLVELLSEYVVKIEGFEDMPVKDVLDRTDGVFNMLIARILNPLSEIESKNSASSPDSPSMNSAGNSTVTDATPGTVVTETKTGDASDEAEL